MAESLDCPVCGSSTQVANCPQCNAQYYAPRVAIAYARSGGFAGIVEKHPAKQFKELSPHQRKQLTRLLEANDFRNMPNELPRQGADTFVHSITVTYGDGTAHTVSGENVQPYKEYPAWSDLVGYVRKIFEK